MVVNRMKKRSKIQLKGLAFRKAKGFTLIEILVVIGIIAILAGIVLIAINPARQFKQARDTQRTSNVNEILNAIGQNLADNKGIFTCAAGTLPTSTASVMKKSGGYDIRPCIVPNYMSELPYDPGTSAGTTGFNTCKDTTPGDCAASGDYDTEYTLQQNASTSRITVSAPKTETSTSTIQVER